MTKVLFINCSPRKGNVSYVLGRVYEMLEDKGIEKEIIMLRNLNIGNCKGCNDCNKNFGCCIKDDMVMVNKKLIEADAIVFGTPNYFDNVTALAKAFIDRTNPLYFTQGLKGKLFFAVVVGGQEEWHSKKVIDGPLGSFYRAHKMMFAKGYCFRADLHDDLQNDERYSLKIDCIAADILENVA